MKIGSIIALLIIWGIALSNCWDTDTVVSQTHWFRPDDTIQIEKFVWSRFVFWTSVILPIAGIILYYQLKEHAERNNKVSQEVPELEVASSKVGSQKNVTRASPI